MSDVDYPVMHFESPKGTQVNLLIDQYNNLYYNRIEADGTNHGWNSADRNLKAGDIQPTGLENYLTKSDAQQSYVQKTSMSSSLQSILANYPTVDDVKKITGLDQYLLSATASETYVTKDQLNSLGLTSKLVKGVSDLEGNNYYPDGYGIIDLSSVILKAINNSSSNVDDYTTSQNISKVLAWSGTTDVNNISDITLNSDVVGSSIEGYYKGIVLTVGIQATEYSGGRAHDPVNLGVLNGDSAGINGYYMINKMYPLIIPIEKLPIGGSPITVSLTGNGESFVNTDPALYKVPGFNLRRISNGVIEVAPIKGQSFASDMSIGAYYKPYLTSISVFNITAVNNDLANGTTLWEGSTPDEVTDITLSNDVYSDYSNVGGGLSIELSKYCSIEWDSSSANNSQPSIDESSISGTYFDTKELIGSTILTIDKSKLNGEVKVPSITPIKESSKGLEVLDYVKKSPSISTSSNKVTIFPLVATFRNTDLGTGSVYFRIKSISSYTTLPSNSINLNN